jgi:hypothetical protein
MTLYEKRTAYYMRKTAKYIRSRITLLKLKQKSAQARYGTKTTYVDDDIEFLELLWKRKYNQERYSLQDKDVRKTVLKKVQKP